MGPRTAPPTAACNPNRTAPPSAFAAVMHTPDDHMLRENRWSGGPVDVRFFHLRFADHDEEHGLSIGATLAESKRSVARGG